MGWILIMPLILGGILTLISYVFIDRRNAKEVDYCGDQEWKHGVNRDYSHLSQEVFDKSRGLPQQLKNIHRIGRK